MSIFNPNQPKKMSEEEKAKRRASRSAAAKLANDNKTLQDKLDRQEEAHDKEIRKLKRDHERIVEDLEDDKSRLSKSNTVLLNQVKSDQALEARKLELDGRERVMEAREKVAKTIEQDLASSAKKIEEAREEGIKKGYADGVADGIREASKITAEDRKMAMQVALVSAASHNDEAATEIAKATATEVAKDALSLPNGKSTKKR